MIHTVELFQALYLIVELELKMVTKGPWCHGFNLKDLKLKEKTTRKGTTLIP